MPRFHRFAIALALSTSLVAAGPALAKAKEAKPAPIAELVKAVDIPYQSFTLDNGLRVIVHEDQRRRSSRCRSGIASDRRMSPRARRALRICSSI